MTLKIDRSQARIRLSGKLRSEHLDQLQAEIELRESPAILDLDELDRTPAGGTSGLSRRPEYD